MSRGEKIESFIRFVMASLFTTSAVYCSVITLIFLTSLDIGNAVTSSMQAAFAGFSAYVIHKIGFSTEHKVKLYLFYTFLLFSSFALCLVLSVLTTVLSGMNLLFLNVLGVSCIFGAQYYVWHKLLKEHSKPIVKYSLLGCAFVIFAFLGVPMLFLSF